MVVTKQQQVSQERYEIITNRYKKYLEALNDVTKEPVNVFDPLCERSISELELIREVSKTLQAKKEEDLKKAAQAASQDEEEAKKSKETPETEESPETEETPETPAADETPKEVEEKKE